MRKRKVSTNDLKNPIDRNDLWKEGKDGYFKWLFEKYAHEPLIIRKLEQFVEEAKG